MTNHLVAPLDLAQLHAAIADAVRAARHNAIGAYMADFAHRAGLVPILWNQRGAGIEGTVDDRLTTQRPAAPIAERWRAALALPAFADGRPGVRFTEGRTGVGAVRICYVADRDLAETWAKREDDGSLSGAPFPAAGPGSNTVPTGRDAGPVGSLPERDHFE